MQIVTSSQHTIPPPLAAAAVHVADLLNPETIRPLLQATRPTHLLHFAWTATPGVYWTSPDNRRWLAASTLLLREFCEVGGKRAVMAGSCAEYDWTAAGVCAEATSPTIARDGATPYAACKLELQEILRSIGRQAGISTAWGRIFFQYGPHEHESRLVSSVINALLRGAPALCSHGRQIRSFLHAADVGSAFAALLTSPVEGIVNIGAAEPISIAALIGMIGAQIGRPELIRLGARPAPADEPPVLLPATARLTDEVGWRPKFSLDLGIADTIAWWRRQPA